jgi:hypothetical protein
LAALPRRCNEVVVMAGPPVGPRPIVSALPTLVGQARCRRLTLPLWPIGRALVSTPARALLRFLLGRIALLGIPLISPLGGIVPLGISLRRLVVRIPMGALHSPLVALHSSAGIGAPLLLLVVSRRGSDICASALKLPSRIVWRSHAPSAARLPHAMRRAMRPRHLRASHLAGRRCVADSRSSTTSCVECRPAATTPTTVAGRSTAAASASTAMECWSAAVSAAAAVAMPLCVGVGCQYGSGEEENRQDADTGLQGHGRLQMLCDAH